MQPMRDVDNGLIASVLNGGVKLTILFLGRMQEAPYASKIPPRHVWWCDCRPEGILVKTSDTGIR